MEATIANYELALRMQAEVPDDRDLGRLSWYIARRPGLT